MTLTEFLLARIAEDEAAAKATAKWEGDAEWDVYFIGGEGIGIGTNGRFPADGERDETCKFISRHDPARVLRECEAKRQIVAAMSAPEELVGDDAKRVAEIARAVVLGNLAAVYSDHPDYDEEWKP